MKPKFFYFGGGGVESILVFCCAQCVRIKFLNVFPKIIYTFTYMFLHGLK
jgi:hypothetical protein